MSALLSGEIDEQFVPIILFASTVLIWCTGHGRAIMTTISRVYGMMKSQRWQRGGGVRPRYCTPSADELVSMRCLPETVINPSEGTAGKASAPGLAGNLTFETVQPVEIDPALTRNFQQRIIRLTAG